MLKTNNALLSKKCHMYTTISQSNQRTLKAYVKDEFSTEIQIK